MRRHRPANWPSFWSLLEQLIEVGRCVICEEVKSELRKDTSGLYEWVKGQSGFVINFDTYQESVVMQVMREFPRIISLKRNKGGADPFVIALAKCHGHTVVTQEGSGSEEGPKIPFVCKKYGIPCMDLSDMIAQEGWRI